MRLHTDLQVCRWYRKTWRIKRCLIQRAPLLNLLENVLFCLAVILWPSPTDLEPQVINAQETVFLQMLPLICASCCFEILVPPSIIRQHFCEVSPFLLHLCCSSFPVLPLQTRCSSFQTHLSYNGGSSTSEKWQSQKTIWENIFF